MIIYVDGPEKAGKTTLVNEILKGFDLKKSKIIKQSGQDEAQGRGYLRAFINSLDHGEIFIWDRGWASEVVYGKLMKARTFSEDPFQAEWFYGRAMGGKGGKFILLPEDPETLVTLRDETDLEVDSAMEYRAFQKFAETWGYTTLINDYTSQGLQENTLMARKSAFLNILGTHSTDYIGAQKPSWTFVGDTRQQFAWKPRPFYDDISMEYFRPFGKVALQHFGYASVDGYQRNKDKWPELFRQVITVGRKAEYFLPAFPNVPFNVDNLDAKDDFVKFVYEIAKEE